MNQATANFIYDKRRKKKDDTYPVKLSIYCDGRKKLFDTGISLSESDWKRIWEVKLRDEDLKKKKRELIDAKSKAEAIFEKLDTFTFDRFEKLFYANPDAEVNSKDVYKLFDVIIAELYKEHRPKTAVDYETAKKAFKGYKKNVSFTDITKEFLQGFERNFLSRDRSPTTIGIYCRALRVVYNRAIELGIARREDYPFKKYKIPGSRNVKKAMSTDQIKQVKSYEPSTETEAKARDFWLFSFYCNGMNIKDICKLKYKNINLKAASIVFHRSKTINTKKHDLKPIHVELFDDTKAIIEKWGNPNTGNKEAYIFPILSAGLTSEVERKKIQFFNRNISRQLKKIAGKLGIDTPLNNMSARHSYATVLKRKGASTAIISENLGHSSQKTTEHYLDSFSNEVKRETAALLRNL
jgi:integrase/recombinase XerD